MKFIDPTHDAWQPAADDGTAAPAAFRLFTLEQWQAVRETWPAGVAAGVRVANTVDIESLKDDLPRLALVALEFPKWVDGRAYSQARTLRSRLRYAGELRAVGDVVVDMMPLLARLRQVFDLDAEPTSSAGAGRSDASQPVASH